MWVIKEFPVCKCPFFASWIFPPKFACTVIQTALRERNLLSAQSRIICVCQHLWRGGRSTAWRRPLLCSDQHMVAPQMWKYFTALISRQFMCHERWVPSKYHWLAGQERHPPRVLCDGSKSPKSETLGQKPSAQNPHDPCQVVQKVKFPSPEPELKWSHVH